MDWFSDPNAWVSLLTLTVLEIVLGIDNIIFISILSSKLSSPKEQASARRYGLMGAFVSRVMLLLSITWVMRLTEPLFTLVREFDGRDIILLLGGLFLIGKATLEIHESLEGGEGHKSTRSAPSFAAVIFQIMLLDSVFSLDSVITAVGMADDVSIMVTAVIIAVGIMMVAAEPISAFVSRKNFTLARLDPAACSSIVREFGPCSASAAIASLASSIVTFSPRAFSHNHR